LCAFSSPCYPLLLFIDAGPAKRSRPRYFRPIDEGVLEDEVATHQKKCEVVRRVKEAEKGKKAKAVRSHKGKAPRVNYKTMCTVSYSALRQLDWYTSQ
jgi:hypothetical protein